MDGNDDSRSGPDRPANPQGTPNPQRAGVAASNAAPSLPPVDRYANAVQVHAGVYDFKLDFGLQDAQGKGRAHTSMRISPQHAKALHLLLGRFLHNYEHSIGEIPLPKQLIQKLSSGDPKSTNEPA